MMAYMLRITRKRHKVEKATKNILIARDKVIAARKELREILDILNTAIDEFLIETVEEDEGR
tara:strand:- start:239 stop:424 length:186 start_codon:yes stop_codon:yes gene_type:complete